MFFNDLIIYIYIYLQVHQAVLDAGEEETGCTIHEVTEQVDGGPILIQKKVKVRSKILCDIRWSSILEDVQILKFFYHEFCLKKKIK